MFNDVLQAWFGQNWKVVNWLLSSAVIVLGVVGVFAIFVMIHFFVRAGKEDSLDDKKKIRKKAFYSLYIAILCLLFPIVYPIALGIADRMGVGKIFENFPNAINLIGDLWVL